jgi:hypothetical protein
MTELAIVEAFLELSNSRREAGKRHQQALCFALFTLAVAADNRGFLAIGDCLKAYQGELVELFQLPKERLPSYSTIRRALLRIEYQSYSACLSHFFGIQLLARETMAMDGKVLRGSYATSSDNPTLDSHPAIMLVSAYIVERGLILEADAVASKTNAITAIPALIKQMAVKGVVFASDAISIQKNSSDNH